MTMIEEQRRERVDERLGDREALDACRSRMSPAMRWEKNAMGRCSTFQRNSAVLHAAIRALRRLDMRTVTADTSSSSTASTAITPING